MRITIARRRRTNSANLKTHTGNVQEARTYYGAAIQDYTQAIALDPWFTANYIYRCGVNLRISELEADAGNAEEAEKYAHAAEADGSQVIDLDPGNARGYSMRGVANLNLGILEDAKGKAAGSRTLLSQQH